MQSKTVLITGTSSGIGNVTAKFFQRKGWNVIATMRDPGKAEGLSELPNVQCLYLDVTKPDSIDEAINKGIARFGKIDAVVNNAGYGTVGAFEASSVEQVQKHFDTNVFGVMNVTRAIIPYFRKRMEGHIINVTSVLGRMTLPLYQVYHSTKWAVEGFSESLQHELLQFNIKVKVIEPGQVKTNFYEKGSALISFQKDGLTAYDAYLKKAIPNLTNREKGAEPIDIAKEIYKAANSNTSKMRYPVGAGAPMFLFMQKLMGPRVFNKFIRRVIVN